MKEYYLEILNNQPDASALFDEDGKLLFYNKSFSSLYVISDILEKDISLKEIIHRNVESGQIIHKEEKHYDLR